MKPAPKKQLKASNKDRAQRGDLAPDRIVAILKALDEAYPNVECALTHRSPWELLVATILSAQCTDVRVNMVTPELFRRFPTRQRWPKQRCPNLKPSSAPPASSATRPNRSKARPAKLSKNSTAKFRKLSLNSSPSPVQHAKPPTSFLAFRFGKAEGVVVDTHVFRIAHRLGLAKGDTPQKVEQELMQIIPQDRWIAFSHQSFTMAARCASPANQNATAATSSSSATLRTKPGIREDAN